MPGGPKTMTVRLSKEVGERLAKLADATGVREDLLAVEAIETYLDASGWMAEEVREAVERADRGGPFVSHEDVVRWVESWGSADEFPRPAAKRR
jgi:predicted transcriptional regulator